MFLAPERQFVHPNPYSLTPDFTQTLTLGLKERNVFRVNVECDTEKEYEGTARAVACSLTISEFGAVVYSRRGLRFKGFQGLFKGGLSF